MSHHSSPACRPLTARQIIYDINLQFLQMVERKFPNERDLLSRVSIIEESSVSTLFH